MPKAKSILAWHFLSDAGLMRDGRKPRKVETHKGSLVLCESGLHASRDILDALKYAPGAILCRVRCSGTIVHGDDKLVCSRRAILWRVDATSALRKFARWCASRACLSAATACERGGFEAHAKALRKAARGVLAAMEKAAWAAAQAAWAAARAAGAARDAQGARDAAWAARAAAQAARDARDARDARAAAWAAWAAAWAAWAARAAARAAAQAAAQAAARVARATKGVARSVTRVERPDCRALQGEDGAAWEAEHKVQSALLLRMVRMERKIKGARNA